MLQPCQPARRWIQEKHRIGWPEDGMHTLCWFVCLLTALASASCADAQRASAVAPVERRHPTRLQSSIANRRRPTSCKSVRCPRSTTSWDIRAAGSYHALGPDECQCLAARASKLGNLFDGEREGAGRQRIGRRLLLARRQFAHLRRACAPPRSRPATARRATPWTLIINWHRTKPVRTCSPGHSARRGRPSATWSDCGNKA